MLKVMGHISEGKVVPAFQMGFLHLILLNIIVVLEGERTLRFFLSLCFLDSLMFRQCLKEKKKKSNKVNISFLAGRQPVGSGVTWMEAESTLRVPSLQGYCLCPCK